MERLPPVASAVRPERCSLDMKIDTSVVSLHDLPVPQPESTVQSRDDEVNIKRASDPIETSAPTHLSSKTNVNCVPEHTDITTCKHSPLGSMESDEDRQTQSVLVDTGAVTRSQQIQINGSLPERPSTDVDPRFVNLHDSYFLSILKARELHNLCQYHGVKSSGSKAACISRLQDRAREYDLYYQQKYYSH